MENQIKQIAHKAIEGEISNLQAYTELYKLSKVIDAAIESIKMYAIDEAEKLPKDYIMFDCKINVVSKTTWKYDHIKAWKSKKAELSKIEKKAKAAAKFSLDANSETGELIEPAISTYSNYIKIG